LRNAKKTSIHLPFSLNKLILMKREDERGMRGACVAPLFAFWPKTRRKKG